MRVRKGLRCKDAHPDDPVLLQYARTVFSDDRLGGPAVSCHQLSNEEQRNSWACLPTEGKMSLRYLCPESCQCAPGMEECPSEGQCSDEGMYIDMCIDMCVEMCATCV